MHTSSKRSLNRRCFQLAIEKAWSAVAGGVCHASARARFSVASAALQWNSSAASARAWQSLSPVNCLLSRNKNSIWNRAPYNVTSWCPSSARSVEARTMSRCLAGSCRFTSPTTRRGCLRVTCQTTVVESCPWSASARGPKDTNRCRSCPLTLPSYLRRAPRRWGCGPVERNRQVASQRHLVIG
jgi:hypothetical protein